MKKNLLFVKTDRLTYGQAVEIARRGGIVNRAAWPQNDTFIFMRPGDQIPAKTVVEVVKSLPMAVKTYFKHISEQKQALFGKEAELAITFHPYLCLKADDDTVVNGWVAGQRDVLATDWQELCFDGFEEVRVNHASGL